MPFHPVTLIGLDCATDPRRTGLALARYEAGQARLAQVFLGSELASLPATVAGWIDPAGAGGGPGRALLAVDAPLGWPAPLADGLREHTAGRPLPGAPNQLFRRETDRFIRDRIGKQSLDVGADRLARTAHRTLQLLEDVGQQLGRPVPLAWEPDFPGPAATIEVYPAATLAVYGLPARGYKRRADRPVREEILAGLSRRLDVAPDHRRLLDNADLLDAVVCLLAAVDFLEGRAMPPADMLLARREGWMWVRHPGA